MVTIRSVATSLLLFAALPVAARAAGDPLAAITPASSLSGIVRDNLGAALPGVEVLVLSPEPNAGGAVFHAISGAGGQFVVGALVPGIYRVAAIKPGYVAALGRVNTRLRASVDLVLRPIPKEGELGADKVLEDLSWTLRAPPRGLLRELAAGTGHPSHDTGGARTFAARVQESLRGEVDHLVALGSWRAGGSGLASSLSGNETRMRFAGSLGERGAIQVQGRRGSFDSSSPASAAGISRGTSDVGLDVSYDTSVDENLAMRAFYSTGDLSLEDRLGAAGGASRQSQRSWGYDARWRKQVDASSRVALQVGFQDASLDASENMDRDWDPAQGIAENRAIGAEGSYESQAAEGHLVRLGVRAQRLSLQAPSARLGRENGRLSLDGATGWSLLIDTEDQWSGAGPVVVTYGLALRQGFDGPDATSAAPRIEGSWTVGWMETRAALSYVAANRAASRVETGGAGDRPSPYGYDVMWKARLDPATSLRATASYVPSRADVWGSDGVFRGADALFVTDGFASNRFVAVELERTASPATVSVRVAHGRAEGALAPAWDHDIPVVLLADRSLEYGAARIGVTVPRAGSSFSFEYRSLRDDAGTLGMGEDDTLKTLELDFAQSLVRFAGGRASCRLLVTARSATGSGLAASESELADARRYVAGHKRIAAGVSLAF